MLRAASTGRLGIDRVEPRSAKRILVSIDGEVKSLRTWCTELGINYGTVHARVRRGWDPNEAIGASLRCKEVA